MESNFSDRGFWVREAFGEVASMDLWTAARAKTEAETGEPPYTTGAQLLHEVLHHRCIHDLLHHLYLQVTHTHCQGPYPSSCLLPQHDGLLDSSEAFLRQ